ncbi:Nucleotidyl transferase domain [Moorella glycerini]|jgi:predicted nucleotidyltransferase|uniref:Nucleotidyltransferase domain protein n=1 Tax=Neomoorella stamsii TaxID=1266720 RepID=A0A9X7J641_9FIRM|nr:MULTISPECIES: nucleotidyltransferase domain-containing protein [Moorella]PRR76290.1 Nucleotidyltransferase domain protein [Moorella stamsii]CEP67142.1 Nucleotidyl transferase domain [Moorella glycerini]
MDGGSAYSQYLKKELDRISGIIIENCRPEKIILFGSLARGKANEYSDLDLVVVMDTDMRFMDRLLFLAKLTNPRVGVDFLVYTPEEYRRMLENDNLFLREEVEKRGVVVYDRAGTRIRSMA